MSAGTLDRCGAAQVEVVKSRVGGRLRIGGVVVVVVAGTSDLVAMVVCAAAFVTGPWLGR
jgi:hypothetical protein